eukprot:5356758-Alexandrium_andersonii.AAC.1
MSSNTSSKGTVSPKSDVASGSTRLSSAAPRAGPTPARAGSAWPDNSPLSADQDLVLYLAS